MRPIEFRAFSMEHNMYMVGFGVLPVEYTEKEFGYGNEIILFTEFNGEIRCIPETVGQFTGLKDKNGKKIFEGDIVEIIEIDAFGNLDWNRLKGKVMFSEGAWLVTDNRSFAIPLWSEINEIEVIGNIHENPELLEVAT
ncbi:YopX family protein [Listeria monocytogenes]|uniref:YopX family protein n=2 Tax=Listeriaceae TaxID=186820 RepID=UPI001C8A8E37|nr:YopX family protein [Listeria seeligeri]